MAKENLSKEEAIEAKKAEKIRGDLDNTLKEYVLLGRYKNINGQTTMMKGEEDSVFVLLYQAIIEYCRSCDKPFSSFIKDAMFVSIAHGDMAPDLEGFFDGEALTEGQREEAKEICRKFREKFNNEERKQYGD